MLRSRLCRLQEWLCALIASGIEVLGRRRRSSNSHNVALATRLTVWPVTRAAVNDRICHRLPLEQIDGFHRRGTPRLKLGVLLSRVALAPPTATISWATLNASNCEVHRTEVRSRCLLVYRLAVFHGSANGSKSRNAENDAGICTVAVRNDVESA